MYGGLLNCRRVDNGTERGNTPPESPFRCWSFPVAHGWVNGIRSMCFFFQAFVLFTVSSSAVWALTVQFRVQNEPRRDVNPLKEIQKRQFVDDVTTGDLPIGFPSIFLMNINDEVFDDSTWACCIGH